MLSLVIAYGAPSGLLPMRHILTTGGIIVLVSRHHGLAVTASGVGRRYHRQYAGLPTG